MVWRVRVDGQATALQSHEVVGYRGHAAAEGSAMAEHPPTVLELVAQIVSAHCAGNTVTAEAVPALIHHVHAALTQVEQPEPVTPKKPVPAVHPRRSVFPDHIVCLEDGKRMKMLKRYLRTAHGMTPQQYREKWDLPPDYPMTAPSYAARRSELARQIGLGRKSNADPEPGPKDAPPRRGRRRA